MTWLVRKANGASGEFGAAGGWSALARLGRLGQNSPDVVHAGSRGSG